MAGGVARRGRGNYIVYTTLPGPRVKARLVRIGNSRGVRLPKPLIEEAGLADDVELKVKGGAIVIAPAGRARAGWGEAARRMRERGEGALLDAPVPTRFDAEAWKW